MNYEKHYNALMSTRKNRKLGENVYCEKHHILPRSYGGGDENSNIVSLTAREHFLAHWLLWRWKRDAKSAYAFSMMQCIGDTSREKISSRKFEEIRIAVAEANSKIPRGTHPMKGKKNEKTSASLMGHTVSEETRKKLSEINTGKMSPNKGVKMSEEFSEKLKEAWKLRKERGERPWNVGIPCSEETKSKIGNANKRKRDV